MKSPSLYVKNNGGHAIRKDLKGEADEQKEALNPLENHDLILYTRHFLLFDRRHCAHRQYPAYRGAGAEKTPDEYGPDSVGDD
ncbi:hypothetical protein STZ1_40074 [Bacillus subtilis]